MINKIIDWFTYRTRMEEQIRFLRVTLYNDHKWLAHGNNTADLLCQRYLKLTDPNWKKFSIQPIG